MRGRESSLRPRRWPPADGASRRGGRRPIVSRAHGGSHARPCGWPPMGFRKWLFAATSPGALDGDGCTLLRRRVEDEQPVLVKRARHLRHGERPTGWCSRMGGGGGRPWLRTHPMSLGILACRRLEHRRRLELLFRRRRTAPQHCARARNEWGRHRQPGCATRRRSWASPLPADRFCLVQLAARHVVVDPLQPAGLTR